VVTCGSLHGVAVFLVKKKSRRESLDAYRNAEKVHNKKHSIEKDVSSSKVNTVLFLLKTFQTSSVRTSLTTSYIWICLGLVKYTQDQRTPLARTAK